MADLKKQIEELRTKVENFNSDGKSPLFTASNEKGVQPLNLALKARRVLKGHFGKIYSMHWGPDGHHLISASQDGKIIVWNGFTTNKMHVIRLRSSWVMTCAYSPSGGLVACGGLDNICSVYRVPQPAAAASAAASSTEKKEDKQLPSQTYAELAHHEGYLSCCRFVSDSEMLTSSGDASIILWDIEHKSAKHIFNDHTGDVMSVAFTDKLFASGSVDATVRMWDYRIRKACIKIFTGHESDVNTVSFLPDGAGQTVGSGSDDGSVRLFDLLASRQIGSYSDAKIQSGITSVAFTTSGRTLVAGYDDCNMRSFDVLTGSALTEYVGHENRVSCLGVSPKGTAVCTGSWDTLLKIWA